MKYAAASLFALLAVQSAGLAQDLYDPTVLRSVAIQFQDTNWLTLLKQNYQSQTNILADITIEHRFSGVRAVIEGSLHRGDGHVVQLIARRLAAS